MHDFDLNRSILIASPDMLDPVFSRSVVYLQEYNIEGAFGFILNRPDERSLSEAIQVEDLSVPDHISTWFGGPVDTGIGVVASAEKNEKGDATGISVGTDMESIHELVDYQIKILKESKLADNSIDLAYRYRFLIGYAGWSSTQLEEEIKAGGWLQLPFDAEICFDTPWQQMWSRSLEKLGVRIESLGNNDTGLLN